MIGRLRGCLVEKVSPYILLDVAGVGYEIETSMSTFCQLPQAGKESILFTHLVVREDAQLLYGFSTRTERELFRELLKINGVGPKLALSILSVLDSNTLLECVHEQNIDLLIRVPGVGKKTASRLLIEMQGRLDFLIEAADADVTSSSSTLIDKHARFDESDNRREVLDAINALISLGYKQNEATKAVREIKNKQKMASEQLIRQALQTMVS